MAQTTYQADVNRAKRFLFGLLDSYIPEEGKTWLETKLDELQTNFSSKDFYLAFSLVSRKVGSGKFHLQKEQIQEANQLREGFNPANFDTTQVARILLALSIPDQNEDDYISILNTLFSTGEVQELVALYSGLPLYPHPELLRSRASEGVRTNMTIVFDSLVLNNPFPADYMDEDAWNQMVLKAVFMERPLDKIYGIDKRANKNLAGMLSDYAHERWAAKRYVTPELWRPVGPFIDEKILQDIERLFNEGKDVEQQAAALASLQSNNEKAKSLLDKFPELKSAVVSREINWHTVAAQWYERKI